MEPLDADDRFERNADAPASNLRESRVQPRIIGYVSNGRFYLTDRTRQDAWIYAEVPCNLAVNR